MALTIVPVNAERVEDHGYHLLLTIKILDGETIRDITQSEQAELFNNGPQTIHFWIGDNENHNVVSFISSDEVGSVLIEGGEPFSDYDVSTWSHYEFVFKTGYVGTFRADPSAHKVDDLTSGTIINNYFNKVVTEHDEFNRIHLNMIKNIAPLLVRSASVKYDNPKLRVWAGNDELDIPEDVIYNENGAWVSSQTYTPPTPDNGSNPVFAYNVGIGAVDGATDPVNFRFDIEFSRPSYKQLVVNQGDDIVLSNGAPETAFFSRVANQSDAPISKSINESVVISKQTASTFQTADVFNVSKSISESVNASVTVGASSTTNVSGSLFGSGVSSSLTIYGSATAGTAFSENVGRSSSSSRTRTSSRSESHTVTQSIFETFILQPLSLYDIAATYSKPTISRTDVFTGYVDFDVKISNVFINEFPLHKLETEGARGAVALLEELMGYRHQGVRKIGLVGDEGYISDPHNEVREFLNPETTTEYNFVQEAIEGLLQSTDNQVSLSRDIVFEDVTDLNVSCRKSASLFYSKIDPDNDNSPLGYVAYEPVFKETDLPFTAVIPTTGA